MSGSTSLQTPRAESCAPEEYRYVVRARCYESKLSPYSEADATETVVDTCIDAKATIEGQHTTRPRAADMQYSGRRAKSNGDSCRGGTLCIAVYVCSAITTFFLSACGLFSPARVCFRRCSSLTRRASSMVRLSCDALYTGLGMCRLLQQRASTNRTRREH